MRRRASQRLGLTRTDLGEVFGSVVLHFVNMPRGLERFPYVWPILDKLDERHDKKEEADHEDKEPTKEEVVRWPDTFLARSYRHSEISRRVDFAAGRKVDHLVLRQQALSLVRCTLGAGRTF